MVIILIKIDNNSNVKKNHVKNNDDNNNNNKNRSTSTCILTIAGEGSVFGESPIFGD